MFWFRKPSWCWFLFGLLLTGGIWCAEASPPVSPPSSWSGPEIAALVLYLVVLAVVFVRALARSMRTLMAWHYRCHPERIGDLMAQLDSGDFLNRAEALQVLGQVCGEPFGPVMGHGCSPDQFKTLRLLYKEWWQATEGCRFLAEQEREHLFCRIIDRIESLRDSSELPSPGETKYPATVPSLARLPPLPPGQLVAVLRPHVEETLRRVAGIINSTYKDIPFAHIDYRVRRLFAHLCWEALECGWQLRFAAAEGRLARSLSAWRPWVRGPEPPAASPPSLGWAEKYRRMSAPETTAPGREGISESHGSQAGMTWAELAAALRRKVDETLDRLNEAIKDALMDGDLPFPSEDDSGESRPLPPLSREEFVAVMRPRIEEALRGMADSLNESGGADAVGELLEALLRDALQTGLEMRARPQAADALVPQDVLH